MKYGILGKDLKVSAEQKYCVRLHNKDNKIREEFYYGIHNT